MVSLRRPLRLRKQLRQYLIIAVVSQTWPHWEISNLAFEYSGYLWLHIWWLRRINGNFSGQAGYLENATYAPQIRMFQLCLKGEEEKKRKKWSRKHTVFKIDYLATSERGLGSMLECHAIVALLCRELNALITHIASSKPLFCWSFDLHEQDPVGTKQLIQNTRLCDSKHTTTISELGLPSLAPDLIVNSWSSLAITEAQSVSLEAFPMFINCLVNTNKYQISSKLCLDTVTRIPRVSERDSRITLFCAL